MSKSPKNLSQNVVHSDPDLILHNSSVLIDKEPFLLVILISFLHVSIEKEATYPTKFSIIQLVLLYNLHYLTLSRIYFLIYSTNYFSVFSF